MQKRAMIAASAGAALALGYTSASALQFVPPAGYSGKPGEALADTPPEVDGPRLVAIPQGQASHLVFADANYRREGHTSHVKVVGAFSVIGPARAHLTGASSPGFLPVVLSFSNGRCYSLEADYVGGALSNGRLTPTTCQTAHVVGEPPSPPHDPKMQPVGYSWGYGAWVDARGRVTTVSAPFQKTFQPLFTAHMSAVAILAMNGVDYTGGDVTLVGMVKGRPTVLTMEVAW